MPKIVMDRVKIGVVSRPHGVRGELRVHLFNSDSTALEIVTEVFVNGREYAVASARLVRGGALLRLDNVIDRNQAESLVNASVEVLRDELALEDDDVLLDELVGCSLVLEDGSEWGQVESVMTGVQDILVIHHGGTERYLPLVDAFLSSIDIEGKRIVVAPPPDLPEWEI